MCYYTTLWLLSVFYIFEKSAKSVNIQFSYLIFLFVIIFEKLVHVYHGIWSYPPLTFCLQLYISLQHISPPNPCLLGRDSQPGPVSAIQCAWMWGHPFKHGKSINENTLNGKWFTPLSDSPKLSTTIRVSFGVTARRCFTSSMPRILLAWSCVGLLHITTANDNLWLQ